MEEEDNSRMNWLLEKKLLVSDFEKSFDKITKDGQYIMAEFVDWESSGPTYSLNGLKDHLCGAAKFCFDANRVYLFGLEFACRAFRKIE